MTFEVVSVLCGSTGFTAPGEFTYRQLDNRGNHYSPCQMYQRTLESSKSDIIMYAHDDLVVHEKEWVENVIMIFRHMPEVAAVGLGGATTLGNMDLYRRPYAIQNLARGNYMSNQDDAETHGKRDRGVQKVAVLDAFFMAVRRDFLLSVGGWPVNHLTHHCLDLWLACELARRGLDTYMVGVSCWHKGGGSSVKDTYKNAKWLQGHTLESDHEEPHKWIAHEYADVLPLGVG